MTPKQKLDIEQSTLREKINAALATDEMTAEQRAELGGWTTRAQEVEVELRAAIVAEAGQEAERRAEFDAGANGDGEQAEMRGLLDKASLGDYLAHATAGTALDGAEAELNAALEVRAASGTAIPWAALDGPRHRDRAEHRADAATTTTQLSGPEPQRPILQRLFGRDVLAALGVRIDSVPAGMSEWPLLTGGAAAAQVAEDAALGDAVAASFDTQVLKPKRLSGRYVFTVEQAAQVIGLEAALRRDLGDVIRASMSDAALNGNGVAPNVTEGDDTLALLRADVARLKGQVVLTETLADGYGEGRQAAPGREWEPRRIGANPPDALVSLRTDAAQAVLAACGVPVELADGRPGNGRQGSLQAFSALNASAAWRTGPSRAARETGRARPSVELRFAVCQRPVR